jgi:hypothetical protein
LHRYFAPFLPDQNLTSTTGLIDFLYDFVDVAVIPSEPPVSDDPSCHEQHTNILRYAVALDYDFERGGRLDFVPAGRQGPAYGRRVNSFDWHVFYERLGGGAFLETVKQRVCQDYDYVLIDSRTGVSDTAGICTIQMPDSLIVFFTANNQSMGGAASVATSVYQQTARLRPHATPLEIVPVFARVDLSEADKLDAAREQAKVLFDKVFDDPDKDKPGAEDAQGEEWSPWLFSYRVERDEPLSIPRYEPRWRYIPNDETEMPYIPYYAYEEVLAVFRDGPRERNTLLASMQALASRITGGEVLRLVPPTRSIANR